MAPPPGGGAGWRAMPAAPPRALLRGLAGFRVVRGGAGAPGAPPHGGRAPGGARQGRGDGGGGGPPGEALLGVVEGVEGDEEGDEEAPAGTAAPPPAQLQLRVRLPGGELLLLPAVPEIVPAWSPAEGLLLGYPPPACSSSPAPTFRTSPRRPPPAAAPPRWPKWSSRTCGATRCPTGAPTA